jgi:peptidyl-prolyl cis-trans isomerase C
MKRVLFPIAVVLVACLAGCKKPPAPPPAASTAPAGQPGQPAPAPIKPMPAALPNVLAKVNGEPVERWELENAVKRAEARSQSPLPPDKRDEVLRGLLDQLVAFHLLDQAGRAQKVPVSDADVDAQLATIRKNFPTDAAFQQGLTSEGISLDQLKKQMRSSLVVQKFIESEIDAKIAVSDAEIADFYKQNTERFKQGEAVHASHILIAVPQNADATQKTQARAKAEQILKQVKGGADFAKIATEQSQDPGSAPRGGDLGFFPRGQMTPAFEEAAFKLKDGAISGIVETPFGFHIIKLLGHTPARTVPVEEAGPQIKQFLMQGQREMRLQQYLEQAKAKTKIDILV